MRHLLLLLGLVSVFITVNGQDSDHLPGEFLVQLSPGVTAQELVEDLAQRRPSLSLQHGKVLSALMDIHLFLLGGREQDEAIALAILRKHPWVLAAQYNHRIQLRGQQGTDPNDSLYTQQWHLKNTGQITGGVVDADIDADEAWDLTTGGPTALGDTMVIAVIDDGFDLNHEDLNWWRNSHEIPFNGLDDDGNGFIDDVKGWNAYGSNDNVPNALHGTEVAGVISAIGDNGIGVTGVTWDLQLMAIAGAASIESIVIESYAYALAQRRLYDQSNGQRGAYVVATNASFGVDNANPVDYPLWCAIYDSLGQAGIINIAATMNRNQDVEVSGDIPSRCLSDFLVAVTSSTPADNRFTGSAIGAVSVDLFAPGTFIRTTVPGNGYGNAVGTSFAAPQVAGTFALMFARACPAWMIRYQTDPAATILEAKQLLLASVDTLPSLNGLTLTGGRLNAFRSLQSVDDLCNSISTACLPPYRLLATSLTDTSARLQWTALDSSADFRLRYRLAGNAMWEDSVDVDTLFFSLVGLSACTEYEWQVATRCGVDSVSYGRVHPFTSEGCCDPPAGIRVEALTETELSVGWDPVFGATGYLVSYRDAGQSWQTVSVDSVGLSLTGLVTCTDYLFTLRTICPSQNTTFGDTALITTQGCGPCLDLPYCTSRGVDVSFEWIDRVEIGAINQQSGSNDGYAAFTSPDYFLPTNQAISVTLTPGYSAGAFEEAWRIWVDLNQDGVFDDQSELSLDSGPVSEAYQGVLTLPDSMASGNTRMRVSMRFAGFTGNDRPESCQIFVEGEVEDYCVVILPDSLNPCPPPSTLEVTQRENSFRLDWDAPGADSTEIQLTNLDLGGTQIYFSPDDSLVLGAFPACTQLQARIRSRCGGLISGFSDPIVFTTSGCGPCVDLNYCRSQGKGDSLFLTYVAIGDYANASESDQGYGAFLNDQIPLNRGTDYPIALSATQLGGADTVYFQAWADWDQDGNYWFFDQWFGLAAPAGDTVRGTIRVPSGVGTGQVRLRIAVRQDQAPAVCEIFSRGEVEDYCMELTANVGVTGLELTPWKVYPNPNQGQVEIESPQALVQVTLSDLTGRTLLRRSLNRERELSLNLAELPAGWYVLKGVTANGYVHRTKLRRE
ncbi:MAG: GEVED domain-containing protein [Bacteroidota bacterium]